MRIPLPLLCSLPAFLVLSPKSRLIQLKKEKLEYTPGEHEYGLFPAPIHVGESCSSPGALHTLRSQASSLKPDGWEGMIPEWVLGVSGGEGKLSVESLISV